MSYKHRTFAESQAVSDERQPDANYRQMCVNLTADNERLRATACEYDCKCARGHLCRVHRGIVGELDTQLTELREAVADYFATSSPRSPGFREAVVRAVLAKITP